MAAPRRSTRQRFVPDRLVAETYIGARATPAPNPWIKKRDVARTMSQRAKAEVLGGPIPGARAGDPPLPGNGADLKLRVDWIYQSLVYFFAAIEAFQHAGKVPGTRGTYPPPPVLITPRPRAVVRALRDLPALPRLKESWEHLWTSLYSFLGFPVGPGAVLPPKMTIIHDLGDEHVPDTIRGIPDMWRGMRPLKEMQASCSRLKRLLDSPEELQDDLAGKTIATVVAVVMEDFESQLNLAEAANVSAVPPAVHGAPFTDHQAALFAPVPLVAVPFIPGLRPNTEIEHAISSLLFAAHELSGDCVGYYEGRSRGSRAAVLTLNRATASGRDHGRKRGYRVGGNAMADRAMITGIRGASLAGEARGLV